MRLITTLNQLIGIFCILALTALILMMIWGMIDEPEQVWRVFVSLGVVYLAHRPHRLWGQPAHRWALEKSCKH